MKASQDLLRQIHNLKDGISMQAILSLNNMTNSDQIVADIEDGWGNYIE